MIFINPKTDFAFKKIFGSDQSKDILISFLNAILYNAQPVIEDLEILNPYQAPRIRGVKDTYLDVKAKIIGDKTVIIKMQVLNVEEFEKRILHAAKAHSIQIDAGEDYNLLNLVIALTITDFEMFPHLDKVISRFVLKEKDYLVDYLIYDNIELVFVELPKFNKELAELQTLTDKWIYFIKQARKLQTVPPIMAEVPEIQKAFELADRARLTRVELEDLEKREIYIYDKQNTIKEATSQGMKQKAIEIAKQLLKVLNEKMISKTTGLSLEEVQQLKREG
jgi:predicted transposase/invertase (TIGR01784 family)